VKDCGRVGEGGESQGTELMRKGRKSSWEGQQWIVAQEKVAE
jgi:hypothetical protein